MGISVWIIQRKSDGKYFKDKRYAFSERGWTDDIMKARRYRRLSDASQSVECNVRTGSGGVWVIHYWGLMTEMAREDR